MLSGNLTSPLPPSEIETMVISFPKAHVDQVLFFGVKVNHSENRMSEVSNIVSTAIVYIPPEVLPTIAATNVTSTHEPEVSPLVVSAQALLAIKWTFAIGVPVMFVIVLVLAIKVVRRRNDGRKSKQTGRHNNRRLNGKEHLPYVMTRANQHVSEPGSGRDHSPYIHTHDIRQRPGDLSVPIGGYYYTGTNYYEPEPDY